MMIVHPLAEVARAMVAPGKGLLAADESTGTANKRFAALQIPQTEEMRRSYREMLFTTPGVGRFISGVILYDETIRQRASDGRSFVDVLTSAGITPGIKVDKGAVPLALCAGEKITEGLDGLASRVKEYAAMGAKFAKWRAVIEIAPAASSQEMPTPYAVEANAHALARYAAICQEGGLVPIVEPEVLMDGDHDHTIERSLEVHELTLRALFSELARAGVAFEGVVLKPSMVLPGLKSTHKVSARTVADVTVEVLMRTVPATVAGIAFLSGGQSPEEATERLQAINEVGRAMHAPWPLTFSYSRALQGEPMRIWNGDEANAKAAQEAFSRRAELTSAAASGTYTKEMERALVR